MQKNARQENRNARRELRRARLLGRSGVLPDRAQVDPAVLRLRLNDDVGLAFRDDLAPDDVNTPSAPSNVGIERNLADDFSIEEGAWTLSLLEFDHDRHETPGTSDHEMNRGVGSFPHDRRTRRNLHPHDCTFDTSPCFSIQCILHHLSAPTADSTAKNTTDEL
jgi:hypothetical protein